MFFPYLDVKRLDALWFWAKTYECTCEYSSPCNFSTNACWNITRCTEEETEVKEERVKPERLEAINGWMSWKEKWDNYMSQVRGAACNPLIYLYTKEEKASPESLVETFESGDERLYAYTLKGRHYKLDSVVVYMELKSLQVDVPIWTFIKKFKFLLMTKYPQSSFDYIMSHGGRIIYPHQEN